MCLSSAIVRSICWRLEVGSYTEGDILSAGRRQIGLGLNLNPGANIIL